MRTLLAGLRLVAIATLLGIASPATALPPDEKDWEIQASFYGWLASLDAEIEAGGVQTDLDMSFFDILGDLGWAVMGGVEGRYQRALLLVDVVGMQIVTDESGSGRSLDFQRFAAGPGGELRAGAFDVDVRLTTWMLDVKPGFRVLSIPVAGLRGGEPAADDRRRLDVDLFAGFRYWRVTNRTSLEIEPASLTIGGVPVPVPDLGDRVGLGNVRLPGEFVRNGADRTVQETKDWFDPIVGLRVGAGVTRRWSVFVSGDVGGFGLGDDASDFTWQAMLGSRFALSDRWSLATGYRALGVDRDTALANAILHGPQLGVLFRF